MRTIIIFKIRGPMVMDDGSFERGKNAIGFNCYDASYKEFYTDWNNDVKNVGVIYFDSEETAKAAIEEIVKPFIEEHPNFDVTMM